MKCFFQFLLYVFYSFVWFVVRLITVNNNNSPCIKCNWRQGLFPATVVFIHCKLYLHLQFLSLYHEYYLSSALITYNYFSYKYYWVQRRCISLGLKISSAEKWGKPYFMRVWDGFDIVKNRQIKKAFCFWLKSSIKNCQKQGFSWFFCFLFFYVIIILKTTGVLISQQSTGL